MTKIKIIKSEVIVKRSQVLNTESNCVECGNTFKVSLDEIKRFKEKKIPIPTRCKPCRRYKLIEIKLKKLTKVCFQILDKISGANHEPKLQKKPSQGKPAEVKS